MTIVVMMKGPGTNDVSLSEKRSRRLTGTTGATVVFRIGVPELPLMVGRSMPYFVCTNIETCERLNETFPTVAEAVDFAALHGDLEDTGVCIIDERGQSVVNRETIAGRARELGRSLPQFSATVNFDKKL